jgi:hypothetical protein
MGVLVWKYIPSGNPAPPNTLLGRFRVIASNSQVGSTVLSKVKMSNDKTSNDKMSIGKNFKWQNVDFKTADIPMSQSLSIAPPPRKG